MRILLLNPNRYLHPPVPPIGLEYIAGELVSAGHETRLVDLCFSDNPFHEIDGSVDAFRPDIAAVTVRNIDTVLYQTNEFFLDGIRSFVRHIRGTHNLRVLIGGPGVSADPEGVLAYLEADAAVEGAGEGIVVHAAEELLRGNGQGKVYRRQYSYEIAPSRRTEGVDYQRYLDEGGIAGFQTHRGCGSSCLYCIEADTPVTYRKIPEVIEEIRLLVGRGCTRFHLCDSEFNEDPDYALEFLRALKSSGLAIDWTLYMKPANHSRKLLRLMKETGVSLITLTVDSWKKCPLYWTDIEKIIFSAHSSGIRLVVDFLTGFPYEDEETLLFYLDFFRRLQPDQVGINIFIRLYRNLRVTQLIRKDSALKRGVLGRAEDRSLLRPVFYNSIGIGRMKELINGDPLFRLEGTDRGVNYCRRREEAAGS
ncbi:MAG: cobalamin-dependent protein [Nitrospiraceae bacterium]|nr:cobalamin-dependent protein [Nitrospiraceae bacterium]